MNSHQDQLVSNTVKNPPLNYYYTLIFLIQLKLIMKQEYKSIAARTILARSHHGE